MSIFDHVPRDPSPRLLGQFGGLGALCLGGSAAWQLWARHPPGLALGLSAAAAAIGLVALLRPRALRPVFVGWMLAAAPIGWAASTLALAILYYAVITPLAVAFRLRGRDALALRRRPDLPTYWTSRVDPTDPARYLRQY